jgi:hypothetical protein
MAALAAAVQRLKAIDSAFCAARLKACPDTDLLNFQMPQAHTARPVTRFPGAKQPLLCYLPRGRHFNLGE